MEYKRLSRIYAYGADNTVVSMAKFARKGDNFNRSPDNVLPRLYIAFPKLPLHGIKKAPNSPYNRFMAVISPGNTLRINVI